MGTTGWGAQYEPRRWEAPRLAYLITADYATSVQCGETLPPVGKRWDDVSATEQRDVLIALACQMRVARKLAEHENPAAAAVVALSIADRPGCPQARAALAELARDEPGPWALPRCQGCRAYMASALCMLQYSYYAVLGFSAAMITTQAYRSAGN